MDPLLDAAGRVGFVAGAAGGIGSAVVEVLRRAGARVAGTARGAKRLPAAAENFLPLTMDPISEDAVAAAMVQTAQAFGSIDMAVNMVGMVHAGPLAVTTLDDWRQGLEVNLTSCFLIAKHIYPHLKKSRGVLILCSSTNGLNGGSALSGPAYAAAKAGIINLNRYLAKEWAGDGIRVHCVAPGPVATPMLDRLTPAQHDALKAGLPLGAYTTADQVARAVAFLCSSAADNMTGTLTNVSGGLVLD